MDYAEIDRLAENAKAGDKHSRELLTGVFRPLVLSLKVRFPMALREDGEQMLWLAFLEGIARFDKSRYKSFAVFIKQHLKFTLRRAYEKNRLSCSVVGEVSFDAPVGEGLSLAETLAMDAPGPEDRLVALEGQKSRKAMLQSALKGLSESQREILARRCAGMGFGQIAKERGVSRQAVEACYRRAVKKLQAAASAQLH